MKDELIDILNDDLSLKKTVFKSDAHKNGWLHSCIHVWFYTHDGQLLIQKRSPDKETFPDLWDVSVAGHVGSSEPKIDAAIRETAEEIGITITADDLEYIGKFTERHIHNPDFIDNEVHTVYVCKLKADINHLIIQEEELSEIKLIDIRFFIETLKKPNHSSVFVPHYPDYYSFVFEEILKRISKNPNSNKT